MPKIVLAAPTIAAMMSVTWSAWMNVGLVSSVPDRREAVLEHPVEDHPHRDHEQEQQIPERCESQEVAAHASCLRVQRSIRSAPTSTTSDSASSTTETAAAADGASLSIWLKMYHGRDLGLERDVPGDEDDCPELADRPSEGERDAREDRRHEVRQHDPPEGRERAGAERGRGLLHLPVELEQNGLHRPDDEGERDEQEREPDRDLREGDVDCRTGSSARSRASSVRPATIVGSANGRSMTALTMLLPGNESRTSTQAISVPLTALIATTISEMANVSFRAATASGRVTAFQKLAQPSSNADATTAAIGMRTIRLR